MRVFGWPANGECGCVLEYDGQSDHVFNVNNKTLVHYSQFHSLDSMPCFLVCLLTRLRFQAFSSTT